MKLEDTVLSEKIRNKKINTGYGEGKMWLLFNGYSFSLT
jgi:hypothetical protein